ncbi:MAG: hypothetical protein FJ260_11395 [Planctomycetes bacterium]|nr:hypothetical protein [Planctomycetota bacterium]
MTGSIDSVGEFASSQQVLAQAVPSAVTAIVWGIVLAIVAICFLYFMVTRWVVNVGATQIAITERRFSGRRLPAGRVFAANGEVGIQGAYLAPGMHIVPWPFIRVVGKFDFVTIGPDELGVITATDGEPMPSGRIYAEDRAGAGHDNFQNPVVFLNGGGIRGKQLRFLTNGTFKIHPLLFQVEKIKKTVIPQGAIGVVTAADGIPLDQGQLLGKRVEGHDSFQKAEIFLTQGGQKGPQIEFLRPGTYNIFADMFAITLEPAVAIADDQVGMVEARDGRPMSREDVVAPTPDVNGHNSFQDGQAFLDAGGFRGPQESVLRPGTYYINPYLFSVVSAPLTVIRQGEVGVLISNIGKDPATLPPDQLAAIDSPLQRGAQDPEEGRIDTGVRTRHVVPEGFRGIQRNVLGPGKYNINPRAFTVIPIPTTTRSVEWGGDKESGGFDPFMVVSHDGFEMRVEVRCQYRILPENAPYVVQKLGSIADLEANVIHPQIDGIFRAQVSKSPAISYQQNRAEEQTAAERAVRADLTLYKVEVVSVMITNIHLPEALMKTTQEKNLAEQRKSMFDAQEQSEKRRIEFQKTKAQADQQDSLIKAEVGIAIAKHEASQAEERARGTAAQIRIQAEAEASRDKQVGDAEAAVIRAKGEAQAEAYRKQVEALTANGVTMVEVTKAIAAAGLKITPDVVVGGGNGREGGGLVDLLLANMVREQRSKETAGAR